MDIGSIFHSPSLPLNMCSNSLSFLNSKDCSWRVRLVQDLTTMLRSASHVSKVLVSKAQACSRVCPGVQLRAKNFQHPRAIAHLHVNAMAKLSTQDMLKKSCWIEWTVDLMQNRTRRGSNCPKTEDAGEFLRLFRHLLPKIDQRSTDHSIPHHQKPLLHSWNSFKERLGDAQISKSQDAEGKMNPLAP